MRSKVLFVYGYLSTQPELEDRLKSWSVCQGWLQVLKGILNYPCLSLLFEQNLKITNPFNHQCERTVSNWIWIPSILCIFEEYHASLAREYL